MVAEWEKRLNGTELRDVLRQVRTEAVKTIQRRKFAKLAAEHAQFLCNIHQLEARKAETSDAAHCLDVRTALRQCLAQCCFPHVVPSNPNWLELLDAAESSDNAALSVCQGCHILLATEE